MLYLAETKKQTKNFLGSYKTELRLLACKHSDETWSAVPTEEVFQTEEMNWEAKEGTLWMLNLSHNRSLQGAPDFAAPELIRQLQKLSRLSEKIKDQQGKIDSWRESLTFQSQELHKREVEIEARESELEEQSTLVTQIEQQQYEVDQAWQRFDQEQSQLTELKQQFGSLLESSPENRDLLQALLQRLGAYPEAVSKLTQVIAAARQGSEEQQALFNQQWQMLSDTETALERQQMELQQRSELFTLHQQELDNIRSELDKAKIQFQLEQQVVHNDQKLLAQLNHEITAADVLQTNLYRLATGALAVEPESQFGLEALEEIPLGELETTVQDLQKDLDKLVNFVNDQEEELTYKYEEVEAIRQNLVATDEYSRITLEQELSEAQEQQKMLNETLIGQRHNLKERQSFFLQHLKVLRRRQGVIDLDEGIPNIDLEPVIQQLESRKHLLQKEQVDLEVKLESAQQTLNEIGSMITQFDQMQQEKQVIFDQESQALEAVRHEIIHLEARNLLLRKILQPLQDQLDIISPSIQEMNALILGE